MQQPDHLRNALIRMRNGSGLRRVIRDDGANGLWISNPNSPAEMYHITREEFDNTWELDKSGDQQTTEDLSGVKWGQYGKPAEQVVMNRMQNVNSPTVEVTEVANRLDELAAANMEITDREAMKREILGKPVLDATFSGDPVGGNEEPITALEEDRGGDVDAAEDRAEELDDQFQTLDAPDAQLDDDTDPDAPADAGDTEGQAATEAPDEPTAGNEDPATAEEAEAEAAPKKTSRRKR
jgi:hypothetical protein